MGSMHQRRAKVNSSDYRHACISYNPGFPRTDLVNIGIVPPKYPPARTRGNRGRLPLPEFSSITTPDFSPAALSSPTRHVLVDADACPVKEEVYKVALRHHVPVTIVSNRPIRIPDHPLVHRVVVSDAFDAADDWIAQASGSGCVVITADILLADRAIKAGAMVLAPTGKPFTASSIGAAIATRAIMADLRAGAMGEAIGGPPPFSKADRSRFLSALDEVLTRLGRDMQR